MKKGCIIFDLDGVLVDSWGLMQKAFAVAYADCGGVGGPPLHRFRQELGRPLSQIVERMGLPERFAAAYEAASRANLFLSQPFEGVHDVLKVLMEQGFTLALNTGKYRLRTEEILDRFALRTFFSATVTGDEVTRGKPHPESLQLVMKTLGAKRAETFFVGDMDVDMLCARAAGVAGVAALWGIGSAEELHAARPRLVAETIYELPALLCVEDGDTEEANHTPDVPGGCYQVDSPRL